MPRYWVIAPVEAKDCELFDKVWQFDLANNVISIGWSELGDVSQMNKETLATTIALKYSDKPPTTRGLYANMLWSFYHEIVPGDFIIARRGQKTLAGIGKVVKTAEYHANYNPDLALPGYSHGNFLTVEWLDQPRNVNFDRIVFNRPTLSKYSDLQFCELQLDEESTSAEAESLDNEWNIATKTNLELEKYLEELIVGNFDDIFCGKLKIYEESDVIDGHQYKIADIGRIDILAVEPATNAFVVIELKRGRPSDQVVGQVLRYMGWVKENLCKNEQQVKGLIICHDADPKLSYALKMTNNVDIRYYSVSINLKENA
jgi:restriction system protein